MLLSHRICDFPEFGARFENHFVLHSGYRLAIWSWDGLMADDRLLARRVSAGAASPRSILFVPLQGTLGLRTTQRERQLEPGECLVELRSSGCLQRIEGSTLVLAVEWEEGPIGRLVQDPSATARLGCGRLDELRGAVAALMRPALGREPPLTHVQRIFSLLRSIGVPLDAEEAEVLCEPEEPRLALVGRALDALLSFRGSRDRPMLVDLEAGMGLSRRQVQRNVSDYLRRYHFTTTAGWRDQLHAWRTIVGTALMSTEAATTERVATLLGFSTPSALCNFFAEAGLPSPGRLRRELLQS